MIKTLKNLDKEKIHLNTIKTTYVKPIASIILNEENNKFPLKSGVRQECPLTALNILLNVLARVIRQEKQIKKMKMGKEKVQSFSVCK